MLVSKIDEFGKVGWVGLTVLGFWLAWPVGLMMVAFLVGSGRIGSGRYAVGRGQWLNMSEHAGFGMGKWNRTGSAGDRGRGRGRTHASASGNKAFDDYRDETLRRLEDEEREFQDFLERLRKARDKSEFDAFMAERRDRASPVAGNAGTGSNV